MQANNDEACVHDERGDGDVVEERRKGAIGAELIGGPERESKRRECRFCPLLPRRVLKELMDDECDGDHAEREGSETIVSDGRERVRCRVPGEKGARACKRKRDESSRNGSARTVLHIGHGGRLASPQPKFHPRHERRCSRRHAPLQGSKRTPPIPRSG